MDPKIAAYIAGAPAEQRPVLEELRGMIAAALPDATEELSSDGFVVFTRDGAWLAGYATRKKGPMFYCMAGDVMRRHGERLGSLMSGKSCIEYRAGKGVSFDEVKGIVGAMLRDLVWGVATTIAPATVAAMDTATPGGVFVVLKETGSEG